MRSIKLSAVFSLVLLCLPTAAHAARRYVLTDLGSSLGASQETRAFGINSDGQVVGTIETAGGAFLWQPTRPNSPHGTLINIGSSGSGPVVSSASAINDYGQVVGCDICNTFGLNRTFLWTPSTPNGTTGNWINLGGLPNGSPEVSTGISINAMGQVAGAGTVAVGPPGPGAGSLHGFLWTPTTPNGASGSMIDLGDLPGGRDSSQGLAINSYGQVAGVGNTGFFESRAILWTPATPNGTTGSLTTIVSVTSAGSAINSMGQVAGWQRGQFGPSPRAFLWTPTTSNDSTGTVVDLGFFVGGVTDRLAMNSLGEIVGARPILGAVLWTPDVPNGSTGAFADLNTLLSPADDFHWTLLGALGINDKGQIVGLGQYDPDGPGALPPVTRRAFLLTPVPEPHTLGMLAIAAMFVSGSVRWRS